MEITNSPEGKYLCELKRMNKKGGSTRRKSVAMAA
jgi:hypothetical protein